VELKIICSPADERGATEFARRLFRSNTSIGLFSQWKVQQKISSRAACLMALVMMMGRKVAADLACCVIRDTHCALTELFAMQIIHTNKPARRFFSKPDACVHTL